MGWSGQLLRQDGADAVRPEDRWERTIWRKFRPADGNQPKSSFHPLAPTILTYQLPIFGEGTRGGWEKIDLVGVSADSLPVVIELKGENANDSPLAVVLEAVRYGIAVRHLWECGLREQWVEALTLGGITPVPELPRRLTGCHLICAAPGEYWNRRGPMTTSGKKYREGLG
jgi:hypothetical protein